MKSEKKNVIVQQKQTMKNIICVWDDGFNI